MIIFMLNVLIYVWCVFHNMLQSQLKEENDSKPKKNVLEYLLALLDIKSLLKKSDHFQRKFDDLKDLNQSKEEYDPCSKDLHCSKITINDSKKSQNQSKIIDSNLTVMIKSKILRIERILMISKNILKFFSKRLKSVRSRFTSKRRNAYLKNKRKNTKFLKDYQKSMQKLKISLPVHLLKLKRRKKTVLTRIKKKIRRINLFILKTRKTIPLPKITEEFLNYH